jgi:hypothetical protein
MESGLWFLTRRPPPTGKLFLTPLVSGPLAEELTADVVADLERARPEIFVLARWTLEIPGIAGHPVMRWFATRYAPMPENPEPERYFLFMRRGGALQARLRAGGAR